MKKRMEFSKKWLIGCIIISIVYTTFSYVLAWFDNTVDIKVYKLTIRNKDSSKEKVTAITFSDGNIMELEDFVIG